MTHTKIAIFLAPRRAARALVRLYRLTLSPLIGFHCRHMPTCSQYADEALGRFGLWAGGWMTLARLLRCQPWGTSGLDFVPGELPARAHWYLPWRYGQWGGGGGGRSTTQHPPPPYTPPLNPRIKNSNALFLRGNSGKSKLPAHVAQGFLLGSAASRAAASCDP
jgi:uncharacterized protein